VPTKNFKNTPRARTNGPAVKPATAAPGPRGEGRVPAQMRRGLPLALTANGSVDHAALTGQRCATCHNGSAATGPGGMHPKTSTACGACHSTVAWSPVMHVDHAEVLGTCISCHTGKTAIGKPPGHVTSAVDCDRCHTTSAWKPAAFDHGGVIPGTCATCHNGLQAPTKGPRHVLTQDSCDTCHYVLGWTPTKPSIPPMRRVIPPRTPGPPRVHSAPMTMPRMPQ
jgi:predicted CXXCH cytochrome family protein